MARVAQKSVPVNSSIASLAHLPSSWRYVSESSAEATTTFDLLSFFEDDDDDDDDVVKAAALCAKA